MRAAAGPGAGRPRVLFIHGLESSPQGDKARYLAARFDALTPAMDTGDFPACLAQQAEAVRDFHPDVVVGSSFGGALAVLLLEGGVWRGPTLLLAQAIFRVRDEAALPDGAPVLLVHGTRDDVVPIEGSRRLARTGTPGLVRLREVDDGHRLGGLLAGEALADLVREVWAMREGAG